MLHATHSTVHQVELIVLIAERRHDEAAHSNQLVVTVQAGDGVCNQIWTTVVVQGLLDRPTDRRVPRVDGMIPVLV